MISIDWDIVALLDESDGFECGTFLRLADGAVIAEFFEFNADGKIIGILWILIEEFVGSVFVIGVICRVAVRFVSSGSIFQIDKLEDSAIFRNNKMGRY